MRKERKEGRGYVLVEFTKKSPRALRGDSKRCFIDGCCRLDFIFCGLKEEGKENDMKEHFQILIELWKEEEFRKSMTLPLISLAVSVLALLIVLFS